MLEGDDRYPNDPREPVLENMDCAIDMSNAVFVGDITKVIKGTCSRGGLNIDQKRSTISLRTRGLVESRYVP